MENRKPKENDAKKLIVVNIIMTMLVIVLFGLGPLI